MVSQQLLREENIAETIPGLNGCDESRCVSKGRSDVLNGSFTCYGDGGTYFPMACADGFLPAISHGESAAVATVAGEDEAIPLWYFTCCPPYHLTSSFVFDTTRQCSDPITITDEMENPCSDAQFPRPMKTNIHDSTKEAPTVTQSMLCCDSENLVTGGADYLYQTECVPYRNEFYEILQVQNEIGRLRPISCELEDFPIPRPAIEGYKRNSDSNSTRFECCRTGSALPPFVKDTAFRITVYPIFTLNCVSAIVSTIVALGLALPLLRQISQGNSQSPRNDSSGSLAGPSTISRTSRSNGNNGEIPFYSTYNLYLVYLAILDLYYTLLQLSLFGRIMNQTFSPKLYPDVVAPSDIYFGVNLKGALEAPYVAANMWLNAFIAYQVLLLLQTSQRAQRTNQPSISRVNAQAGAVGLISVLFGCLVYVLMDAAQMAANSGNYQKNQRLMMSLGGMVALWFLLPFGYVLYVAFIIWKRGYLPCLNSNVTSSDKALRELAFYFFRIVGVFVGIYLPAGLLGVYALATGPKKATVIGYCLVAIQPLVTTCVILTKSDARKYLLDLITLSCCRNEHTTMLKKNDTNTGAQQSKSTESFSVKKDSMHMREIMGDRDITQSSRDATHSSRTENFFLSDPFGVPEQSDNE